MSLSLILGRTITSAGVVAGGAGVSQLFLPEQEARESLARQKYEIEMGQREREIAIRNKNSGAFDWETGSSEIEDNEERGDFNFGGNEYGEESNDDGSYSEEDLGEEE